MKLWHHKYLKLKKSNLLRKFSFGQKYAKMANLFVCQLLQHFSQVYPDEAELLSLSIMSANFLRIGSLDLSHILHEVERP